MNNIFEPELGQICWSNSPHEEFSVPEFVKSELRILGDYIDNNKLSYPPGSPNNNCAAYFSNDVFTMRSYCHCDGDIQGHEQGCPPNFQCGDFQSRWYKHLGRGASVNRKITPKEWARIFSKCLDSLTPSINS